MSTHPSHVLRVRHSNRLAVRGLAAALLAGSVAAPASAQMLVGDGSLACGSPHVVESGDTLSVLAQRAYGDSQLYGFIANANWDALGGDPESVAVGMELAIPCIDASGEILTPEQAAALVKSLEGVVKAEGPLTADELDTLFGPVALFPDQVLTPVLVAATFPLDVVKAARFVDGETDLTDKERAAQAVDQPWDMSVRELAAGFPDLLARMNDNIDWTEQAGEAVVAQTDDVLNAIQRLRVKAQENGYLVDNEAQKVEEVDDKIVIAPASPGVVYVPTYDSQVVYATPVSGAPVYHYGYGYGYDYHDDDWGDALIAGGIFLGGAIILDEIFDDDDWNGWDSNDNIDWDGGDITIDRGDINIGGGDRVNIGDGDRPQIGDGDRPRIGDGDRISIGDSDRTQVDRDALANAGDRAGAGDRPRAGALPAGREPISNQASRDVARQKIETRKDFGVQPATLKPARPAATSPGVQISRPTNREAPVSKPKVARTPTAKSPGRSSAFQKPSRSPSASGSRGRASAGSRGGGGRSRGGGGGGRRR